MGTNLQSLSEIFNESTFRIPDYQRGYAWSKKELDDFWIDLENLSANKSHYIGMITVSKKKNDKILIDGQQRLTTIVILIKSLLNKFNDIKTSDKDDNWIMKNMKTEQLQEKYLFREMKNKNYHLIFSYELNNPSYGFYKYKILDIEAQGNIDFKEEETLYVNNLKYAKDYFKKNLNAFDKGNIEVLLNKILYSLKFNLYEINNDELDEYVIFETMNNRGKPLTTLEVFKNRLIYLSTLMDDEKTKKDIRESVNESWKMIYEYLGKPSNANIKEDTFLLDHYRMYWGKSDSDAKKFLLHKFFIISKVLINKKHKEQYHEILDLVPKIEPLANNCMLSYKKNDTASLEKNLKKFLSFIYDLTSLLVHIDEEYENSLYYFTDDCKKNNFEEEIDRIICNCNFEGNTKSKNLKSLKQDTIQKVIIIQDIIKEAIDTKYIYSDLINLYSSNIQDSIKSYYFILNPEKSNFSSQVKKILIQINTINIDTFMPTIMGLINYINEVDEKIVVKILKLLEKFIFVKYLTGSRLKDGVQNKSYKLICSFSETKDVVLLHEKLQKIIENSNGHIDAFDFDNNLYPTISKCFKTDEDDMDTKQKGYYEWNGLRYVLFEYELYLRKNNKNKGLASVEKKSIEHIYPSSPKKGEWNIFSKYNRKQKYKIRNSIGNLLLMSLQENKKLQNKEFDDKKERYKDGNFSEVQVSKYKSWTTKEIKARGEEIISFMNDRWSLGMSKKEIVLVSYFDK